MVAKPGEEDCVERDANGELGVDVARWVAMLEKIDVGFRALGQAGFRTLRL